MDKMDQTIEHLSAVRQAHDEIVQLRHRNEILEAKVEVIDTLTAITRAMNRQGGYATIDVVGRLRIMAEALEKQRDELRQKPEGEDD